MEEIDRVFEIKYAPGSKLSYTEAAKQAKEDIEEAVRFALESPEPELDTLELDVYA